MVTIDVMPYKSGIEISATGMQASSAINSVMTNSVGCISPICRLPINRITASSAMKMIVVLKKMRPIQSVCARAVKVCSIDLFCGMLGA